MSLEDLPDVHAAGNAERVENDVDGRSVLEERHVLGGQDLRDDALVAVATGELVALGDLALLRDVDAHEQVHARGQLIALLAVEDAYADDLARLAVRHLERGVAHLTGLLAEDRTQETLLRGQLGLALRRDLADEDVARDHVGPDADDAAVIKIGEDFLRDIGDVSRDLLGTELGVASVDLVLVDVDGRQDIVLDKPLVEDDRVLVVVTLPRHECHEEVLPERHLAELGGRAVCKHLTDLDALALGHDRTLVEAGALIRSVELLDAIRGVGAIVVCHRHEVR
ncbi:unannotated protein [freshwater metagenome]|uniref:Unannotated protein n=1 Tax=freshwater metagenome TaxID=449393 RepID=A0A6J7M302_9ZZZZ